MGRLNSSFFDGREFGMRRSATTSCCGDWTFGLLNCVEWIFLILILGPPLEAICFHKKIFLKLHTPPIYVSAYITYPTYNI